MGALEGKVAVVTGASRGIGEAIAIALADDGADLAVLARTQPDLEKTAAEVRESGRKAFVVVCDVASSASVEAGFEGVWEAFGRLDILVNNAGSRQNFKTVDALPEEEWDAVIDVNLKGTFLCSLHRRPGSLSSDRSLLRRQGGRGRLDQSDGCRVG